MTVNVVSTFLLALSLLLKLKDTAAKHCTTPCPTMVTSELHAIANFPEGKDISGRIFDTLNESKRLLSVQLGQGQCTDSCHIFWGGIE
ncbi:hypothetical protein Vi05172_g13387 [Venturia inaequalis]|nr:hypothetical protein Vi05172_g13387 [Venturia inaequalis]